MSLRAAFEHLVQECTKLDSQRTTIGKLIAEIKPTYAAKKLPLTAEFKEIEAKDLDAELGQYDQFIAKLTAIEQAGQSAEAFDDTKNVGYRSTQ